MMLFYLEIWETYSIIIVSNNYSIMIYVACRFAKSYDEMTQQNI